MVEQSYGNVSMSLSRSSSFYLDNNELLLMQSITTTTTTKADLAATPTGSPDEYDDYDDETTDGLKRKQSASSLFFRSKLSESFTQQQEQTSGHPLFKIGTEEDYDSDELMLDTRLYTSVENKLNITLTAPIDMQQRLKKVNSNSSDMDADGLSSTLKESNMLIGSSSSSSGSSSSSSSGSLGVMMSSTGKKGGSNGRKRRQKKRESEGSLNSGNGSNVVKSDSCAIVTTTANTMIPINVSIFSLLRNK